ncbi:MAG: thioredoxin domain-containing protein [Candidatus Altiarchaeota archaeon]|nr:thioredoxin domain-containing protein [Candidatus Altiarchaeota archaeon]
MNDDDLEEIRKKKIEALRKKMNGETETVVDVVMAVNDGEFQEKVIEKSRETPVVVDFWAPWCQPCLMLSPSLERLAKDHEGRFILAKINIDQNRGVAQRYRIMSIPSVKMFKGGKMTGEFLGAIPEPHVRDWLNKNL